MYFFISELIPLHVIAHLSQPCPHCKQTGFLIQHGYLRGLTPSGSVPCIRGKRIFCSNRSLKRGCGRTVSLQLFNRIYHSIVTTLLMTMFLGSYFCATEQKIASVWTNLGLRPDSSWGYRIYKRFEKAQAHIRGHLSQISPPPDNATSPLHQTWLHLLNVCGPGDPIANFQFKFQTSIFSN